MTINQMIKELKDIQINKIRGSGVDNLVFFWTGSMTTICYEVKLLAYSYPDKYELYVELLDNVHEKNSKYNSLDVSEIIVRLERILNLGIDGDKVEVFKYVRHENAMPKSIDRIKYYSPNTYKYEFDKVVEHAIEII